MDRDQALKLVGQMLKNPNLVKHCLAVEAIMRALAIELHKRHPELPEDEFDQGEWELVGLLHDADYEITGKDLSRHTLETKARIAELGASQRVINAIKAHSEVIKPERENFLEKAIFAADELSGLITATALVRPDKKLASVTTDSVLKKFPQKAFAAGASREQILKCEDELGIPLEEFVTIALQAMQKISDKLGL
ncbi:HD domain-containing protein [Patescibacteria group bacterium]|nr:HD domain-containing protein [Patescibacteria group bacterium]MCL5409667.1 HD domain-containing protein [Patescibacteria group bacterium]